MPPSPAWSPACPPHVAPPCSACLPPPPTCQSLHDGGVGAPPPPPGIWPSAVSSLGPPPGASLFKKASHPSSHKQVPSAAISYLLNSWSQRESTHLLRAAQPMVQPSPPSKGGPEPMPGPGHGQGRGLGGLPAPGPTPREPRGVLTAPLTLLWTRTLEFHSQA